MNYKMLAPAGLVAAAMIVAGCGSNGSGSSSGSGGGSTHSGAPAASGSTLQTAKIGGATVLTNSKGFALYWFALDTSTTSKCSGTCASFWPPVKGPATLMSGIKGTLGTIKRSDGSTQATFNGHPLYTFKGDSKPGEDTGNGKNLNGGVWHVVTVSGSAPAPKSSSSKSGGGGYGY